MIKTLNLDEARKQIQNLKRQNRKIIVLAQSPDFNRKILEHKDVDILLNAELHDRKDRMKQRDSGLNEVLCKIAKKNNIKIGFEMSKIIKLNGIKKAEVLARLIQNIKLCRRTKTDIILMGKFDKIDAMAFLKSLGASTSQAKRAVTLEV